MSKRARDREEYEHYNYYSRANRAARRWVKNHPEEVKPFVSAASRFDTFPDLGPSLPELWQKALSKLGPRGLNALSMLFPYFSGYGSQLAADRYVALWHGLCQETFTCRLRELEQKDGRLRILVNLQRYWQAHSGRFKKAAEEAGWDKRTIYHTFWPRAYRLMSIYVHFMVEPLRLGHRQPWQHWLSSLEFSRGFRLMDEIPPPPASIPVDNDHHPINRTRPPLPTLRDFGIDFARENNITYGPGVAYSDWLNDDYVQHRFDNLEEIDTALLRPFRPLDRMYWRSWQAEQSIRNAFTLRGGPSNWKGMRAAIPLFSLEVHKEEGYFNIPGDDAIKVEAPSTWLVNKDATLRLVARPLVQGERIAVVGKLDGMADSPGIIFRATEDTTRAARFKDTWPHTALFRAGLISWYEGGRPMRNQRLYKISLVADLIDIETIWRLAPSMMMQFDDDNMNRPLLPDNIATRPDEFPAWRDATDADKAEYELMLYSMAASQSFGTYALARPIDHLRDANTHYGAKHLFPGLGMVFQLGWLPYERFSELKPSSRLATPNQGMFGKRVAFTLEELLSDDWAQYDEQFDELLKHVHDDDGQFHYVPYYFSRPVEGTQ